MTDEFVHLHAHCEYSLLDGLGRVGDLVAAAAEMNMPALALTDHGTMFGAIEFYGRAKDAGVKPIIGCEVYVSDRPIGERPSPDAKNYHLVLLAESDVGYRNLIRLSTSAHLDGFYRKPRVDQALLEQHAQGLICLSGCASGELATLLLEDNLSAAEEKADWYRQVFGDRYYLELQYHELDFQPRINQGVLHLAQKLGIPLVATNDVHYVQARHASVQDILLCIQTQTTLDDPKRMRFGSGEFYLKSPAQMHALFGQYPGAISNTLAIAERCDLELAFGRPQLPEVSIPAGYTSDEYLRSLCDAGIGRRYEMVTPEIQQRLEYELQTIHQMGFDDYYLLVHDVISYARNHGIAVGPGRGSAAGSLVAYCLFLTNIDPIAHGLAFERFLNPERVTMPDMDLDFADDRRDEVIRYVADHYGRDRVAQIITFGTIGARAGVRDVGRVLGMSYPDVDRVAKLIPPIGAKISRAKEEVGELRQLYDADPAIRRLLDTVEDLEGVARHASTHAAGVVITKDTLVDHVPLYKVPKSDQVVTQYAMASIEKIGLLKLDFLGLRTLTILERARALVERTTGRAFSLDDIPLNDASIYELLSTGDTFGIFQVDGEGMRKLLVEFRPEEFEHVVALISLYRPGPMGQIPAFVNRRHGRERISYIHPALEEALAPTYGVVVYQEQVMKVFSLVAGYSLGEADLVRRAMAKKKPAELAKHYETFLQRAEERGTTREVAGQLWEIVEPFCGYGFPKSHAAGYAVLTCQTAYLKANYPREFFAGLLSAERENAEKVSEAIRACRRVDITVQGPDINQSDLDFTLSDEGIRFGLGAIKHVGEGAIESLLATRAEGGPFSSIEDFCTRVDWRAVNKRVLESLAKCGALECQGVERGKLMANLDRICAFGSQMQRAAMAGQSSLFGDAKTSPAMLQLGLADPASAEECLAWEEELLGFFVSPHPLADAERTLAEVDALSVSALSSEHDQQRVRVGGLIQRSRSFSTKDGKVMGGFQLSGMESFVDVVVFSRNFEDLQPKIADNSIVAVDGKVDGQDGRVRLVADAIWSLEEARRRPAPGNGNGSRNGKTNGSRSSNGHGGPPESIVLETGAPARRLRIDVARTSNRAGDMELILALYGILQRHPGGDEVELFVTHGAGRPRSIPLPSRHVACDEQLLSELRGVTPGGEIRIQATELSPSSSER